MPTVGVYDFDFMNYQNVMPNLECAKICTYFHNHGDIAVLAPSFNPSQYTQFYVRKDYDDGIYPSQLFESNCVYGGRAFSPTNYKPLDPKIERTIPNMRLYDKYINHFIYRSIDVPMIHHILRCAHIRLAADPNKPKTLQQLKNFMATDKYNGIIFHDYDLAAIPNGFELIYSLSQTRTYITKKGINPYAIGNKFPIQLYKSEDLLKWIKITSMPNLFFLEYNGLIPNDVLNVLCIDNKRLARQIYYNISYSCSTENEFFIDRLPQIFKQVLFLRRQNIKILLTYDQKLITTPELQNLLELLNCWLRCSWTDEFYKYSQSLYRFVRDNSKFHYTSWAFLKLIQLTNDQIRNCFQYVRENNYELFKNFYELSDVSYYEGEFINEWERN